MSLWPKNVPVVDSRERGSGLRGSVRKATGAVLARWRAGDHGQQAGSRVCVRSWPTGAEGSAMRGDAAVTGLHVSSHWRHLPPARSLGIRNAGGVAHHCRDTRNQTYTPSSVSCSTWSSTPLVPATQGPSHRWGNSPSTNEVNNSI